MGEPLTTPGEGQVSAEELFRQHAPFVARFLFRLGVRSDGIEDAVQEVFVVVHRQGGYRPGTAKPTTYLANLAVHAAAAYRRRERVRAGREVDAVVEDVASTRGDPVRVLETNELLRRLQAALGRLEPDLRTTLVLVELEGETCASVAAAMGIPVGTVYWRLHQARKKFQRALQATESAPHGALAVQPAGLGGDLGSLPRSNKERTGMMILFMGERSWSHAEVRDLLRLGAARPPVGYAVEEGLARHQFLAASGAPTPSWANGAGVAAKGASWVALSAVAVAIGAAVVILGRAGAPARSSPSPSATFVAGARTPPAGPSSAFAWEPIAPPDPGASDPAVPVDALPFASPAPAASGVARRSATGDSSRDARRLAPLAEVASAGAPLASRAPPSDDDLVELQQVALAERLLSTDPARALTLVRSAEARFPHGYVREERRYVEIAALVPLGRFDEARPKIAAFLRDYPESAFGRRVREASRRVHLGP
ncbi:MAG TPA: sigma-70 family RNA polymerase sigma factor [Polyangiaceae bacterium]|nr:sigma-70 family RNA polymerase sigma factor [Polyangiaceae bacterium]